jgi:hypothetical protein
MDARAASVCLVLVLVLLGNITSAGMFTQVDYLCHCKKLDYLRSRNEVLRNGRSSFFFREVLVSLIFIKKIGHFFISKIHQMKYLAPLGLYSHLMHGKLLHLKLTQT